MENFGESKSLKSMVGRMSLRKRRMQQSKDVVPLPDALLDEEETQLFDAIRRQYQQKIMNEISANPAQADKLFLDGISPFGKKFVVETLAREPLVMGVPYTYFLLNAAICLIAYIWTSNDLVVIFLAPVIHGIQRLFYSRVREERKRALTEKVLRGRLFEKE